MAGAARRERESSRVELSRELSLAARLPQGNAKHRDCHSSSRPATCILRSLQQQQQQQRRSSATHPTLQQPPTVAWFGCQAQGIKWKVKRELQPSLSLHPPPHCPSFPAPLPLCGALLMWPRPRPRPHLDIIVIVVVVGLGFSFGCGLRSFRFVAGRAAAAD